MGLNVETNNDLGTVLKTPLPAVGRKDKQRFVLRCCLLECSSERGPYSAARLKRHVLSVFQGDLPLTPQNAEKEP